MQRIWLKIDYENCMKDDMKNFLKKFEDKAEHHTYFDGKNMNIVIEVSDRHFEEINDYLAEWCYYNPAEVLGDVPNVSDYDEVEMR